MPDDTILRQKLTAAMDEETMQHAQTVSKEFAKLIVYYKCAMLEPLLYRKKTLKTEPVTRETGIDQRRYKSGCAGKGLHLNPSLNTGPHKKKTRIGYAGRARVTYQRHIHACKYLLAYSRRCLVLIELVMALHMCGDLILLEQHRTGSGILSQNQVNLLQHPQRP